MKKYLFSLLALIGLSRVGMASPAYALDDPYYDFRDHGDADTTTPDELIKSDETKGFVEELMGIFGLDRFQNGDNTLVDYISYIINTLLGLAAFIALMQLIYGFYRMFFVSFDDGVSKARDIVKGATIALTVIGLSWVIVRFLFWVVSIFVG